MQKTTAGVNASAVDGLWPLFSQIAHGGVGAADEAGFAEAVFADDAHGLTRFCLFVAEIHQPVVTVNNFPAVVNLFDLGIGRVKADAILTCHRPNR